MAQCLMGREGSATRYLVVMLIVILGVLAGCASTPKSTQRMNTIAGNWIEVQRGDTLGGIARRAGVPVERLSRFNPGVDPEHLAIGQRLLVPTLRERAPFKGPYRYQVRPGDTFSSIARRFDTQASSLQQANPGTAPTRLAVGQLINVPLVHSPTATASAERQRSATAAPTSSKAPATDNGLPDETDDWSWPLADYRIERRYGKDGHGTLQPMLLSAQADEHAKAVADGEVKFAGSMRKLGRVVIIHHPNNLQSVYAQCDALDVDAGNRVEQGSSLCRISQDDATQRSVLLFDMRRGGKPVDPERILP
ncbi:M23 family metallopeptidase [Aidingimonas lacisalsi]|uniref:M23 family metallopeptidase n=1 Tax=Aidingimonas lacisalsi TaxID=2604086 RepID=UPI001F43D3C1|nr:M23 family metallopeptidase [Aidingimonas lacisalsi]